MGMNARTSDAPHSVRCCSMSTGRRGAGAHRSRACRSGHRFPFGCRRRRTLRPRASVCCPGRIRSLPVGRPRRSGRRRQWLPVPGAPVSPRTTVGAGDLRGNCQARRSRCAAHLRRLLGNPAGWLGQGDPVFGDPAAPTAEQHQGQERGRYRAGDRRHGPPCQGSAGRFLSRHLGLRLHASRVAAQGGRAHGFGASNPHRAPVVPISSCSLPA